MPPGAAIPADRILVDEAGNESGIWGKFRLKSAFQLVYQREGEALLPAAVEGRTVASLDSSVLAPGLLDITATRDELALMARIGRAIHIGNLQNVAGSPCLGLFVAIDSEAFADLPLLAEEIAALSARLAEFAIEPGQVAFTFRDHAGIEEHDLAGCAETIRSRGMRVCLEEPGPVFSAPSLLTAIEPDFLRIGADRLCMLAREPQVQRMVRSMFGSLHERGIETLVSDVDASGELFAALEAGARCFQGAFLSQPRLSGTLFDLQPLPIETLRARGDNVVPLFRARPNAS